MIWGIVQSAWYNRDKQKLSHPNQSQQAFGSEKANSALFG